MVDLNSRATLRARAPLADFAEPGRFGFVTKVPGVVLHERTGLGMASVLARNGRQAELAATLSKLVGRPVTDARRRWAADGVTVAGLGTGEWFIQKENAHGTSFVTDLRSQLSGQASVADQSDGRVVIEISGAHAREALAKGIAVDLSPGAFAVDETAQTLAAHLHLHMALIDAAPTFEITCMATFAGNLWRWLEASAAEFGGEFKRS